ncbi:hypothetical protein [Ideonella sp. A 288]|uniref:hypothetical protein n=1 Tax=Ideonella sp. A 288 TaxID=1962181 RepID=UPI000B4BE718|nr:hypothetical protein [Ideonella sp. A 288]
MVMTVDAWKTLSSRPFIRSEGVKRIDRALRAWWLHGAWGHRTELLALKSAIDDWVKSKGLRPDGTIKSERGPAVAQLLGEVEHDLRRRDMVVALWSFNNWAGVNLGMDARIKACRDAIDVLWQRVANAGIDPSQSVKGIFAAPEYFCAAPGAGRIVGGHRVRRTVTANEKAAFVQTFRGISKAAPGVLIVPGSVAWAEPANPSEYAQWQQLKRQIAEVEDPSNYNAPKARVMDGQTASFGAMQHQVPDWDAKKKLALAPGPKLVMHNTAVALLDGDVRYEYHKHSDYFEAVNEDLGPQRMVFLPGAGPGIKTIGGLTFGFEICLDHNIGFLSDRAKGPQIGLSDRRAAPTLGREFHIVVSDSVGNAPAHMALAPGGFFVHASTNPTMTGVWHRVPGGAVEPVPAEQPVETFLGAPLRLFRISQYAPEVKSPARKYVPEAWR